MNPWGSFYITADASAIADGMKTAAYRYFF